MDTKPNEQQPTAFEIGVLWGACIDLEGIPGAGTAARIELREAMERKTTWVGGDEIRLLFAVRAYLSGERSDTVYHGEAEGRS